MAKFGKYRVNMRKGTSFMTVVMRTVRFSLMLYVGGLILAQIATVLGNASANVFAQAFTLLGFSDAGTISTTGLISIVGVLGAVYLIMSFVSVNRT